MSMDACNARRACSRATSSADGFGLGFDEGGIFSVPFTHWYVSPADQLTDFVAVTDGLQRSRRVARQKGDLVSHPAPLPAD
jgi:hypothetical protein